MKGTNTFQLNSATVCEAIQEYLEKRWTGTKLTVTGIDKTAGQYGGQDEFVVTVTTTDPTP